MRQITFLVLALALPYSIAHAESRQLVDQVLAVVNNEVITQSEFDVIFRPIYEQVKEAYDGPNLPKELDAIRLKLLNQLIEDKLVAQEAEKLGITVSPAEVQEQLEVFKQQFDDMETFQAEMERAGMTDSVLEEQIHERLAITRLHQEVIRGRVIVSPAEAERYFQDHQNEFVQEDQVEVWAMTIRKSDEAVKKGVADEAAKRKAEDLLAKLKRGADFSELARAHSEDARAEEGGYLGFIERGRFIADIDQILFSLPERSLSDVLETERAYCLFRVGTQKAGAKRTFDEVREEIRDALYRKKAHERFQEWMEELKKKSYISVR